MIEKKPWPLWLKFLMVLGIPFLMLVVGLGATWLYLESSSQEDLDALRAEMREAGYAIYSSEILQVPPPDDRNGAVAFQALLDDLETAKAELQTYRDGEGYRDEPLYPGSLHLGEEQAKFFEQFDPLVAKLREACSREEWDFQIDFESYATPVPHLLPLRDASNFLKTHLSERLRAGDIPGALEDLRAMANLSRATRREGSLVSQLVGLVMVNITLEMAELYLPHSKNPLADLESLKLLPVRGQVHLGLQGELALITGSLAENPPGLEELQGGDGDGASLSGKLIGGFLRKDIVYGARLLKRMLDAGDQTYPEQLELASELETELQENDGLISGLLVPTLLNSIGEEAKIASKLRQARIAAALLEARKKNGTFPENLSSIGIESEDLVDPHSGMRFIYLRRDDAAWLSSWSIRGEIGLKKNEKGGYDFPEELGEEELEDSSWGLWRMDRPVPPRQTPAEAEENE